MRLFPSQVTSPYSHYHRQHHHNHPHLFPHSLFFSRTPLLKPQHSTKDPKLLTMSTNPTNSPTSPSKLTHSDQDKDQQQEEEEEEEEKLLRHVLVYHNQTKHSLTRYARGPHGLDWSNQPNPFRRYPPCPLLPLEHVSPSPNSSDPLYSSVFNSLPPPQPLSLTSLSQFLYDSLALSAWKTTGFSTWSLRVNPSSGNLHPTESHLILPPIAIPFPSLSPSSPFPFVSHYAPRHHSLELRSIFPPPPTSSPEPREHAKLSNSLFDSLPHYSFLVGISSIFWRESWKYGERAFRYCNHDVGHALAALSFSAASLGWDVRLLDGLGFSDLQLALGLHSQPRFHIPPQPVKGRFPNMEFEHPDCLLLVFPGNSGDFSVDYAALSSVFRQFPSFDWKGSPNSLSKDHVCWDIIYRTAEIVKKPLTPELGFSVKPFCASGGLFAETSYKENLTLREVVRKRRSAVDMDGVYVMERNTFYQILLHCLPSGLAKERGDKQCKQLTLPFRVLPWDCELHMALFVHRVKGLAKGLYFLVRNENHFESLKRAMRSEFEWEKPEGCPDELPLYRLATGDCQRLAKTISCHQDIASHGCFSLGMIARFEPTLREKNVWMYPRLFWESGVLGQVLYLEAHAVGISATGIGCYFDDSVHDVLGLRDSEFQSLYHFTVGSPVPDKRIMSLPAYPGPEMDA